MPIMSLPSVPLLALAAVCVLGLYKFIVYPIFFHPLRHIPSAHWSIPLFGDCWILYQRFKCRNNAVTYAAHLKHGEVVRMGRNELSLNCVDNGIRTVYSGGWEKHVWYPQLFASYGYVPVRDRSYLPPILYHTSVSRSYWPWRHQMQSL